MTAKARRPGNAAHQTAVKQNNRPFVPVVSASGGQTTSKSAVELACMFKASDLLTTYGETTTSTRRLASVKWQAKRPKARHSVRPSNIQEKTLVFRAEYWTFDTGTSLANDLQLYHCTKDDC